MKKLVLCVLLITFLLGACTVVKEYEKVNLNDADMSLGLKKIERFKTNSQSYREAASGANGGKTGGGCGCN